MPLEVNHFPRIIAELPEKIDQALVAACIFIKDGSEQRARVESGDMKGGFRYEVKAGFWAEVWNEKEYAIYNEFGTKYVSAQPMMRPATQETEPKFLEALALAFSV